ncbi:MAG: helix-turn-helix domain-containing protein [Anaerolineae bacterium]|nr:helix-turn-helix domain-containing protein [Anaerolineae bacterium]
MMSQDGNPNDFLKQIGQWLKALREQIGLSESELAKNIGLDPVNYINLESGVGRVDLQDFYNLTQILGIDLNTLLLQATPKQARLPNTEGFLNEKALKEVGLTSEMVKQSILYSYRILDALDQTLLTGHAYPLAKLVELANLSSMLGNLLSTGIADSSEGAFIRNGPHKYPDLLAQHGQQADVEIKVALEDNAPKGHLAKIGYYLIYRYVLCDHSGVFIRGTQNRGDTVYIWEARFGFLTLEHFNISNMTGDSGKTAVVNAEGMKMLKVIYCDLQRCPYPNNSKIYQTYQALFNSPLF